MRRFGAWTALWTFFAVFGFSAFAEFRIVTEKEKIWLEGVSCDELKQQLRDLALWQASRGEKSPEIPGACVPLEGGRFRVEASAFLPSKAKAIHGTLPTCAGPNCFNSAMYLGGLTPYLRHADDNEFMAAVMASNCQGVEPADAKPGDLMFLSAQDANGPGDGMHAYVYLNEQMCFSKNGAGQTKPYLLQTFEGEFNKTYPVPPECRSWQPAPTCKVALVGFRCEGDPIKDFAKLSPEQKKLATDLGAAECALKQPLALAPEQFRDLTSQLHSLTQRVSGSGVESKPIQMLLLARLMSLQVQLEEISPALKKPSPKP